MADGDCVNKYSTRGCFNSTTLCCISPQKNCISQIPAWPPVVDNCQHSCYNGNFPSPQWTCQSIECIDGSSSNKCSVCIGGLCTMQVGLGVSCVNGIYQSTCLEGLKCSSGTCVETSGFLGDCSSDSDCSSGNCLAGYCSVKSQYVAVLIVCCLIVSIAGILMCWFGFRRYKRNKKLSF